MPRLQISVRELPLLVILTYPQELVTPTLGLDVVGLVAVLAQTIVARTPAHVNLGTLDVHGNHKVALEPTTPIKAPVNNKMILGEGLAHGIHPHVRLKAINLPVKQLLAVLGILQTAMILMATSRHVLLHQDALGTWEIALRLIAIKAGAKDSLDVLGTELTLVVEHIL